MQKKIPCHGHFKKQHVESNKCQSKNVILSEQSVDDLKGIQQTIKTETAKSRMDSIDASQSQDALCLVMPSGDKVGSS